MDVKPTPIGQIRPQTQTTPPNPGHVDYGLFQPPDECGGLASCPPPSTSREGHMDPPSTSREGTWTPPPALPCEGTWTSPQHLM